MSTKNTKTNIKYLKENKLYDAHKHFMKLSEAYIQLPEELEEAGEDEQAPDQNSDPNGGMPGGDMGADPNTDPNGGMPPMDDGSSMGDPNADPNGAPDGGMPGGDMGADPDADPNGAPDGGMPPMDDGSAMGGMPTMDDMGMDAGGEDEEVIDVDSLTNAQDKLNVKQNHVGQDLGKVDNKIEQLLQAIPQMLGSIEKMNGEIEGLKSEFQKRTPTATEKLNLRSLDSYPFNVKPTDYWKKQAESGRYDPYSDNDESTTKEYVITNDDVDNPARNIADTFFKVDDDDIQDIAKIFNL